MRGSCLNCGAPLPRGSTRFCSPACREACGEFLPWPVLADLDDEEAEVDPLHMHFEDDEDRWPEGEDLEP